MTYTLQLGFFGSSQARCNVCHRPIWNPDSLRRGIGPVCAGHRGGKDMPIKDTNGITDELLTFESDWLTHGIIIRRTDRGVVQTNVPHRVIQHSPTGYEFGYAGSGPADLALNICEVLLGHLGHAGPRQKCYDGDCFEAAWLMHQDFKRQFIANLPCSGGVIPYDRALRWVQTALPVVME